MKHMSNFQGMPSSVPNDMPWSDTVWSNMGGETITLDHHDSRLGPNMVLELPDSDAMGSTPDSDNFMNHPGFLGITWSSKKAEAERYDKELNRVRGNFPNTGSCAFLTDSLDRIDWSLDELEANKDKGKKGAKRVNARARKARNAHRGSIASAQEAACAGEQAAFQQQAAMNVQAFQQGSLTPAGRAGGMNMTNLLLGVLVLGGIGYGIYKMGKRG